MGLLSFGYEIKGTPRPPKEIMLKIGPLETLVAITSNMSKKRPLNAVGGCVYNGMKRECCAVL